MLLCAKHLFVAESNRVSQAARSSVNSHDFLICKAAFERALFVYPDATWEMRQGASIAKELV